MASIGQKIISSALSGMLIAGTAAIGITAISAAPGAAPEAHAADKTTVKTDAKNKTSKAKTPYMKTLKLKWDLKKNKTVKSNYKVECVGSKPMKITMKNYKTKKLKDGKKKTTFTLVYERTFVPTKSQIHKISSRAADGFLSGYFYAVTDYSTGKSLEDDSALAKELGVKVTRSDWKLSKDKTYKDSHNCWVSFPPKISVKVSITYPANYKGLCLGVGAYPYLKLSNSANKTIDKFWAGEKPFGSTAIYKKGKTNSHWMRIK